MFELKDLRKIALRQGSLDRRLFLTYLGSLSATSLLAERSHGLTPKFADNPFKLGVASGDPSPQGVVLWTRLAPSPLEPGGGMPLENVSVQWEIAEDDQMQKTLQQGTAVATPQLGHSVHVEVDGLNPDRWYHYRFRVGDAESTVGRTRTAPRANAQVDELRFAFASCQHYETGLYTAFEHMAEEDLDLVFHLGDYIYEGRGRDGQVRRHLGGVIHTLDDYRIRHALYKTDEHLQRMHARCPWIVTWDDHELENNYANEISEKEGVNPVEFLVRRANAYQAYYEMMPLRRRSIPRGPHMRLYRGLRWGQLADFSVLDTRQYRTDQPNGDRRSPLNDDARDPNNTMLGDEQLSWLQHRLITSRSIWNVLPQQVMMGTVDRVPGPKEGYSMDQWPGYWDERRRLMAFIQERNIPNPVVLTGDIHSNWVNELRVDDSKEDEPIVASEFVGTSISSGGNGIRVPDDRDTIHSENPCVRWYNRERGYVSCTLTEGDWRSDYQVVEEVTEPGAPKITRASFVVEAGKTGISEA